MLYSKWFSDKIRDKIERVKSPALFVRGYLHQDLVFSKTENQIGFSMEKKSFEKNRSC